MEKESSRMLYKILGISENASKEEVFEAYQKAKKVFSENKSEFKQTFNEREANKLNQFIEKAFVSLSSELQFQEQSETKKGKTLFGSYAIHPEMEERIRQEENFDGSFLREIRVYKNISLNQIQNITKIKMNHLIHLENNQFNLLPREVFVRSYIKKYADIIGLDSSKVSLSFMNHYRSYFENC